MKSFLIFSFLTYFFVINLSAQNRVGIGTSNPESLLSVGNYSQFQVDSIGNISRVKGIPLSFPSYQGGKYKILTNDGNGNLNWLSAFPYGTFITSEFVNSLLDSMGYQLEGRYFTNDFSEVVNNTSGTWSDTIITPPSSVNLDRISNTVWTDTYNEFAFYQDSIMYFYSPTNHTWISSTKCTLSELNSNRKGIKLAYVNNKIYLIGGYGPAVPPATIRKTYYTVGEYNVASDTWSMKAPMPDSLAGMGITTGGTNIELYGGYKYVSDPLNPPYYEQTSYNSKMYTYYTTTNNWASATVGYLPQSSGVLNPTIVSRYNELFISGGLKAVATTSGEIYRENDHLYSLTKNTTNYSIIDIVNSSNTLMYLSLNYFNFGIATIFRSTNANFNASYFSLYDPATSAKTFQQPPPYNIPFQYSSTHYSGNKILFFSVNNIYTYCETCGSAFPVFGPNTRPKLYYVYKKIF